MIVLGTLYSSVQGVLTKGLYDKFNKRLEAERLAMINKKKYYENKTT